MSDNISPEEKLLKLIRRQKGQGTVTDKKALLVPEAPTAALDLKPSLKASMRLLFQKYLSLLSAEKIILAGFAAACIYLVSSFIYPLFGLKEIKLPKAEEEKIALPETQLKRQEKPYEFYLEGIRSRKIFNSASLQASEDIASNVSVNADLIKDITLVGIISGENPQAIFEDKKAQKTYYVTKGQFIGEFQVKDIQEGKVILTYKEQKYELYI